MTRKSKIYISLIVMIVIMSFIGLYVGHFLFFRAGKTPDLPDKKGITKEPLTNPVVYKNLNTMINGRKQVFNILEVDLNNKRVVVKPVLSFNNLFGFEKLSTMVSRSKAYAAVNAGFFSEYGRPSGMVVIDGKLIAGVGDGYPVLVVSGGKAQLRVLRSRLWLSVNEKKFLIDNINIPGKPGQTIIYTHEYGFDNRAESKNLSVSIEDNTVKEIAEYAGKADIPDKGLLVSIYRPSDYEVDTLPLKQGETVVLKYEPDLGIEAQAYECGSWLVKDGKVVIGDWDPWVGAMTNREPRTAVGIKSDGKLALITVDGRQPGYSVGMTGKEFAGYLLENGIQNAAMLDGGASTEMIVNGKVVNKPSFYGQERLLAGGLVIQLTDDR